MFYFMELQWLLLLSIFFFFFSFIKLKGPQKENSEVLKYKVESLSYIYFVC